LALSTSDLSLLASIPAGTDPENIAMAPDGLKAAVAINSSPGVIGLLVTDPLNPMYHTMMTHTFSGNGCLGAGFRPDGAGVYALTQRPGSGTIYALEPTSLSEQALLPSDAAGPALLHSIAFSSDSAKGYATIFQSDANHNLAVFSTSTHVILSYLDLELP